MTNAVRADAPAAGFFASRFDAGLKRFETRPVVRPGRVSYACTLTSGQAGRFSVGLKLLQKAVRVTRS